MVLVTLADIFQRFVHRNLQKECTQSKRTKTTFPKNEELLFLTIGTVYLKCTTENPLSNAAFDNQRSPNVTLHLNKKHVLFHLERSQQVLKTAFLFTTKESSRAELKKTFLERTQRRFGRFLFCSRNNFFISIRYHKTSQTQDGKSQSTNRSLRKPVQAKPNTAVEQK